MNKETAAAIKLKVKSIFLDNEDNTVYQIRKITHAKPGKHGAAKVIYEALDYFKLKPGIKADSMGSNESVSLVKFDNISGQCVEVFYGPTFAAGYEAYNRQKPMYAKNIDDTKGVAFALVYKEEDFEEVYIPFLVEDAPENNPLKLEGYTINYINSDYGRKLVSYKD